MNNPVNIINRLPIKRRFIRLGAWLLVAILAYAIFLQWQDTFGGTSDYESQSPSPAQPQTQTRQPVASDRVQLDDDTVSADSADILNEFSSDDRDNPTSQPDDPGLTFRVTTDVLIMDIAAAGGDIVALWLPGYTRQMDSAEPIQLLRRDLQTYITQNGIVGRDGPDSKQRPVYTANNSTFTLNQGQDELVVTLLAQVENMQITKTYTFARGSYLIRTDQQVVNNSDRDLSIRQFGQIRRGDFDPEVHASSGLGIRPYFGAALTTAESNFKKVDFDDMREANLRVEMRGGWIAMLQHYFISTWIANPQEDNVYLTRQASDDQFIVGYVGPVVNLSPGNSHNFAARLYIGPKILDNLESLAPHLDLTVDFGWLWFIATPLFHALEWIYDYVGNWGVAIILLTMLIKLVFFYPSQLSYRSMARMRKLAPQMQQLRETHGSDRGKLQQEMMALYRREKVNPLGGCLPILIQMPVFIALYWMLLESVQLRHAPFALWIDDLTAIDPYFILPLLMGLTMFIQQLLSPAPPDPTQAKIMRILPIVFTFMFLWFPAGLVLYWVTNNTLSIIQQWVITRSIQ